MLTALSAKNKVKRRWIMVISWLVHSITPSIRQSILWMDNARDIWNTVKILTRRSAENFRVAVRNGFYKTR